jgi:hypothetical protein
MTRSVLRSHCKHLHGKAFILSVNVLGQFSFKSKNETCTLSKSGKISRALARILKEILTLVGAKNPGIDSCHSMSWLFPEALELDERV